MIQITIPNKDKILVYFLLKVVVLYIGWYIAFEFFIKPDARLDHIITYNISDGVIALMRFSGIDATYMQAHNIGETYILIPERVKPLVRIGASCNGLEPLVLFAIFIVAYPGKVKHKLWFIPAGLLVIHIINIARNYALTMMLYHKEREMFHLFHRYVFVIFVYLFIFALWMLWANKFGATNKKGDESQT